MMKSTCGLWSVCHHFIAYNMVSNITVYNCTCQHHHCVEFLLCFFHFRVQAEGVTVPDDNSPAPTNKISRPDPFADLRDGSSSGSPLNNALSDQLSGRQELARYKALKVPANHRASPLVFWRENSNDYPLLSQVARRVLVISASSAQSERDFSSVGRIITDARSSLSARKVEELELIRWGSRDPSIINL